MLGRIKKDDKVLVLSGKDKGKQSVILSVIPDKERVLVKDVNVVTLHQKPKRAGEKGKIVKEEKMIAFSKVMPICPSSKKPCRIKAVYIDGSAKKVRACSCCSEAF